MNKIDYDQFYTDFDLDDFLTKPVGKFDRSELKEILNFCTTPDKVAFTAGFNGIRHAITEVLEGMRDDPQWKKKLHFMQLEEAQEIYCRIWLKEKIKAQYKVV